MQYYPTPPATGPETAGADATAPADDEKLTGRDLVVLVEQVAATLSACGLVHLMM